ncbi:MAG: hypothetical protein ACE5DK_12285 [Paracoccaceae bacterium]
MNANNNRLDAQRFPDFLELEWEEGCLSFPKTERAVRTASSEQVRRRIHPGSSQAWKVYKHHLAAFAARFEQG